MISVSFIEKIARKTVFSTVASIGSRSLAPSMSANYEHFDLSQRRFRSARSHGVQKQDRQRFFPVYVHHVSKIVLEHLQLNRSDWVNSQGLNTRLHINPNGTFVLSFPAKKGYDTGRIWCVKSMAASMEGIFSDQLAGMHPTLTDSVFLSSLPQDQLRLLTKAALAVGISKQFGTAISSQRSRPVDESQHSRFQLC